MLPKIKEDFLHYLWRAKKISQNDLITTDGQSIDVMDFGHYNTEAGPDFLNARIKIDGTLWAGNVEMHVFSSDWHKHRHQNDKAYENVILHVVYEHDIPVTLKNAVHPLPVLELKGKIPKSFLQNYQFLMNSKDSIPCRSCVKTIDYSRVQWWKYALAIERLQRKSLYIKDILEKSQGDWEETCYIAMARYFGASSNTLPFEMMASHTPYSLIMKNKDKKLSLEALFFGQAGMLHADYQDAYFRSLKEEYVFLQRKYQLNPIDPVLWKFGRLRPVNFPTVRIAQFAGFLHRSGFLFSEIREAENNTEIRSLFQSDTDPYWTTHYTFGKESSSLSKAISPAFTNILIINAVTPILYLYGKMTDQQKYIDKAVTFLEETQAEKNRITQMWTSLGMEIRSALDSQAWIELKTQYCQEFRCLSCRIGHEILSQSS